MTKFKEVEIDIKGRKMLASLMVQTMVIKEVYSDFCESLGLNKNKSMTKTLNDVKLGLENLSRYCNKNTLEKTTDKGRKEFCEDHEDLYLHIQKEWDIEPIKKLTVSQIRAIEDYNDFLVSKLVVKKDVADIFLNQFKEEKNENTK